MIETKILIISDTQEKLYLKVDKVKRLPMDVTFPYFPQSDKMWIPADCDT